MDRTDVLRVYDDAAFAAAYNDRFVLSPWAKHGIDFELTILRDLLGDGGRWIDVGCGTGWVLSQFPDVERAGLDLSPAMLHEAQEANPGVAFRQGDFTVDVEEFHGAWDVVSCMWMAYCYLESMPEVEALVANLVRWTAPGGSVFIPSVIDLEDLRPHVQVDYEDFPEVWHGRIAVTGYNWTWEEPNGNVNANMMAVHVGHFVRLLEEHFEAIEVVRYPVFEPGGVSRKAVVARRRRAPGVGGTAEITWHPAPLHPADEALAADTAARDADEAARAAAVEVERSEREQELAHLRHEVGWLRTAHADEQAARAADAEAVEAERAVWDAERSELRRQLAVASHEADWLRDTYGQMKPPLPGGLVDLSGTSTKRLAAELGRRANPARPGFVRSIRRRLPGGR